MRDFLKLLVVGIALSLAPQVFAESYKVGVIPDNIVTENAAIDSYIYNATAEFFADEVTTILNGTDYIKAPTVSETRKLLKNDPSAMLATKNMTSKFRTTYNIDYLTLNKISAKTDAKYALLLTSYIDSENYILRRTVWDFLNIPGAAVVDPAYKISTYAVLVDTENKTKIWSDTFYKTISVCENRIITRGPSPQTEQLQKIKDYSKLICPQIARSVQRNILPADLYEKESTQIDYDLGNIDNVFTKKYRQLGTDSKKLYKQNKNSYNIFVEEQKQKYEQFKKDLNERNSIKREAEQAELELKMEVNAVPVYDDTNIKDINYKKKLTPFNINEMKLDPLEIERTKKNTLNEEIDFDKPDLRDYY